MGASGRWKGVWGLFEAVWAECFPSTSHFCSFWLSTLLPLVASLPTKASRSASLDGLIQRK